MTIKRQIYERIKYIFPEVKFATKDNEFNPDDEWINKTLIIYIKDSTP